MNDAIIKEIEDKIKGAFNFNETQFKKFWESEHPFLGNKSPQDLAKTAAGLRKISVLVNISIPKSAPDGKAKE